jgi:hypothetical protein
MYHPMLTFAVMKTRQEDLLRDLDRRDRWVPAQRTGSRTRTPVRQRLAAYLVGRPRAAATSASSSPCS